MMWIARIFISSDLLGEKVAYSREDAIRKANRMLARQPHHPDIYTFIAPMEVV